MNNKTRSLTGLILLILAVLACVRSAPESNEILNTLQYAELERSYLVHVPPSYDGSQPVPLVLSFHGGGGNANTQVQTTGFSELADEKGFIVVYPNGTGRRADEYLTWNGGACCAYAVENQVDDVGFIRELVAELETQYNVDPKRIFATGMSNGGIFSYRLACDASDLFAAVAPVAGTQNYALCDPAEPVSVIHFHGTDDGHVGYTGGAGPESFVDVPFTSVSDSIDFWLDQNQCSKTPQTDSFEDIQHDTYADCVSNTAVELYTILGGKHAWPGGGGPAWAGGDQPTQSLSATRLIWEFFEAHPKP